MQWFVFVGVDSFRVLRQAQEEEKGPVTSVLDKLRTYYDYSVNVASSYVDTIKDLKLDEKAKWVNLYHDQCNSSSSTSYEHIGII